jgi:hypothetical protein
MRAVFVITIILIQISCSAQKSIKFTAYEKSYSLSLPKGYNLKRLKDDEGYREHQAIYPDSSIVYITDDKKSGGVNKSKEEKYGADVYIKILANENLVLEGVGSDGRYWKEQKQGNIVIGYFNVPPDKKWQYDEILSTLH